MRRPVTIAEEIYPHEYLWRSSTRLLKEIEHSSKAKRQHLILPALLTTLVAFEAFVNFCGFVLLPEMWSDEKLNFKGKPFDSKLAAVVEQLPGFKWDKGARPYQTLSDLFRFRDIVVHAKVHTSTYETDAADESFHIQWNHPWDDFFKVEAVERAREDVLAFSQTIIEAMRSVSNHPHVHFDAYDGSLASASS
jgi:hypothetical protein